MVKRVTLNDIPILTILDFPYFFKIQINPCINSIKNITPKMSAENEPKTIEDYKDIVKILKLKIIKQNKKLQEL